jgi:hypothetical protein
MPSMRTLTVYTAESLVERWKARAERLRTVYGDVGTAHQIECCAAELEAILAASMEMEAAHHGDPEPDTTCSRCGENISPNAVGGWANFDRVAMGAGHYAVLCPDGIHTHSPEADPNALLEWSQGVRP